MPSDYEPQTIDMGASMETEEGLAIIDSLNEVSDVLAMAGSKVTFAGTEAGTLSAVGRLQGVDIYSCPRGWFLLMREPHGPHWAVAGDSLERALETIHEPDLRGQVRDHVESTGLLQRHTEK